MYFFLAIRRLHRSATRQCHTLLSKENIKPSSPTPTQLKYYHLSLLDQFSTAAYVPFVFFYPNHNSNFSYPKAVLKIKNSLSTTLTHYFPVAGTLMEGHSFIHCNDEGAEFSEVHYKCTLSEILENSDYNALAPLCPVSLAGDDKYCGFSPLLVQLNSFDCGGFALSVCMSHKVADGCSLLHFLKDWAHVSRADSVEGHGPSQYLGTLTSAPPEDNNIVLSDHNDFFDGKNCVTKRFIFSNSKLAKLKAIVAESGLDRPTRVQVLLSLLYERAVSSAIVNSGAFIPSALLQPVNIRHKIVPNLPTDSFGNFCLGYIMTNFRNDELSLNNLASQFREGVMQYDGLEVGNVKEWISARRMPREGLMELYKKQENLVLYSCSSLVGYPAYGVDFGWGKPEKVTLGGCLPKNTFLLMDTKDGDGIDVLVTLKKQDMAVFQLDQEILAFGSPS